MEAGATHREVRYRHSPRFPEALRALRCSLLVSTYQAGQLIALGADEQGGLALSAHHVDRAMGVAAGPGTVAIGSADSIWFLDDRSEVAGSIEPRGRYDRCFLPRRTTVTGGIQCHELAWGADGELWVVNTLFSCLATLHPEYSFVPRWRPPFVSALAPEDRCHLNGLALRDGRPAYVTVMARSDEPRGWRADRGTTGCVLDVASGEPVASGLAMPHSPRLREGRLFVLDSGRGTLEAVDAATGAREVVEHVPGFARGLAFHGNLAFVGLSRIREEKVFGGMPVSERHDELVCGVGVIDMHTGSTVATLVFETGVEEVFDVQVVPDARCVALGGAADDDVWVLPSSAR